MNERPDHTLYRELLNLELDGCLNVTAAEDMRTDRIEELQPFVLPPRVRC